MDRRERRVLVLGTEDVFEIGDRDDAPDWRSLFDGIPEREDVRGVRGPKPASPGLSGSSSSK